MKQTLFEKINAVIDTLVKEVNGANKDYVNEKTDLEGKKDTIETSVSIANLRISTAIKDTVKEVTDDLAKEKHITAEKVNNFFHAHL